jgi:hypothetical protein
MLSLDIFDPLVVVTFSIPHQKHKSGRGPSSEHFWQVWLKSVQRFREEDLNVKS